MAQSELMERKQSCVDAINVVKDGAKNAQVYDTSLRWFYEWRYYRCPRCSKVSVQADEAEQTILRALQKGMLPERVMDEARDELARRLKVPTSGLADKQRQRLSTAVERIQKQHMWGDLTDANS
jgi:hypothetical protein